MLGESIATAEFSVASTKDCAGHALDYVALDYVALDYVALDYVGLLHFKEQAGLLGLEPRTTEPESAVLPITPQAIGERGSGMRSRNVGKSLTAVKVATPRPVENVRWSTAFRRSSGS